MRQFFDYFSLCTHQVMVKSTLHVKEVRSSLKKHFQKYEKLCGVFEQFFTKTYLLAVHP